MYSELFSDFKFATEKLNTYNYYFEMHNVQWFVGVAYSHTLKHFLTVIGDTELSHLIT